MATATSAQIEYAPWRDSSKGVGQWFVHQSTARFRALMAGRQSGKSLTGIAEISIDAMAYPGHINWWIAPSYKVKDRAWRGLLEFIPKAVIRKKNETENKLILVNSSEISVKSAEAPDALESEALNFAVCDEAGQWKEDAWARGIRPMFTATQGKAMLIGTPRGKNWFYRLWMMGWRTDCAACAKDRTRCSLHDADYESFKWRSEDSPFSDAKDLAEAKRNLPSDIYKQEYEADPLDNSSGVFRNVRSCIRTHATTDPMMVIGADFARKHDFSCFIPMNTARQALAVHRTQNDWPLQKQQIAALVVHHNFARIVADEAGLGDPVVSQLREAGFQVEGVNTNGAMKETIITNLRLAFENNAIGVPDDEVLIDELESYEYEILPSGRLSYHAPEGKFDDTVIALALALWGQRSSMGMFAQPTVQTSYMGNAVGAAGSYVRGNRGSSSWPL